MIYEPKLILDCIFEGTGIQAGIVTPSNSKLDVATKYALDFVAERALELQKSEMLEDPWGRPIKQTERPRESSRGRNEDKPY